MKFARFFLQLLCIALCFTCTEKEVTPRTYPRIQTLPVDNITPEGARFTAEITLAGQAIGEHGFLWSVSTDPRPEYNSDIINLGAASGTGKFSARAERSLAVGTVYYVRGYLRAGGKLVLGNVQEFKSLGSRAPRITRIEPTSGFARDTVRLYGENFSNRYENIKIMFGDKAGELVKVSDTLLLTRVPSTLASELSVVTVTVAGNTSEAPEKFRLIPPQITTLSATAVAPGDTLTIHGSNFTQSRQFLQVFVGSMLCYVVSHSADEIKIIVPFFRATTDLVPLKVVSSNLSVTHPQLLTYLKPVITSLEAPAEIKPGDTLRLKGRNIFAAALVLKFNGNVITPLSISKDHIGFVIAKDIKTATNSLQASFGQNIIDFQATVTLAAPVVTAVTPATATFNEEIVLTGRNFHPVPGSNTVWIAGATATVVSATPVSLTIKVPSTIGGCSAANTCNTLTLSVLGQQRSFNTLFTLRAPVIESISPTELTNATQLTVQGKYFNPDNTAFNTAVIDGKWLTPLSASSTTLVLNAATLNATPYLSSEKVTTIKVANSNAYPLTLKFQGPYTQKAKTPLTLLQRTEVTKAVAGTRAYIGLGYSNTGTELTDLYEYDADTDLWTRLPDFPGTPRRLPVTFALGDYVYVGMGLVYTSTSTTSLLTDMWRYSITSGTWQQVLDFPGTPKYNPFVFVTGGKAYIGGGNIEFSGVTRDFWTFDGSAWQQKNDIPENNNGSAKSFVQDNGTVYTFFARKLFRYNVSTDGWAYVNNHPSTASFTGGMINGIGYLWSSFASGSSTMQRYNPSANPSSAAWQTWQTPFGIYNPDSFIIGTKLYIFKGSSSVTINGAKASDYVWEFDYTKYP